MKKSFIISWFILFALFFVSPHIIYGVLGPGDSENTENRNLAEFPELSLSTISKFPSSFETYYNDTLPFRSSFITANSLLNSKIFKESSVSKVVIGKENWLFYNPNGGDGDPIGDLHGKNLLTEAELAALLDNLLNVEKILANQGREFVVYIAPNKESIYGNSFLPDYYQTANTYTTADQVVDYIKTNSSLRVVYPKAVLLEAIEEFPEYDFYYNTDTHWNSLGGYIGAKCLIEELGGTMEEVSKENIAYDGILSAGLDLANMMTLSSYLLEENSYYVDYTPVSEILTSNMDFNTEYRFTTTSTNTKKLFLVRDSYCTAMAEHIAPHFSHSVMIHGATYVPSMIMSESPDIVVYEVVERYVRNLATFTVE